MMFSKMLAFALVATTVANPSQQQCALDGAKSVDNMADAAINIWAASQRCGKNDNAVQCEVDITAAAQSVGDMANVIVAAAAECGVINTDDSACGMVVGKFMSATAGLASSIGGIINKCPNQFKPKSGDILDKKTQLGKCIIDSKNALKSVFNIMNGLSHLHGDDAKKAAAAGMWTDFGSYLSGSVNDCSAYKGAGNANAACASHVLDMISHLDRIAVVGTQISQTCKPKGGSRLWEEQDYTAKAAAISSLNLFLGAFLPITAIVSFLVGARVAKARQGALIETQHELE